MSRYMLRFAAGICAVATAVVAGSASAQGTAVSFKLEGCRQEFLPDDYDLEANGFLCDQLGEDGYVTGNLGKRWNELDLVPHRVTTSAGNAAPLSQTYDINIAADHEETGIPGYDVITVNRQPSLDRMGRSSKRGSRARIGRSRLSFSDTPLSSE